MQEILKQSRVADHGNAPENKQSRHFLADDFRRWINIAI
jgi:hypothetical protein